MSTYQPDEVDRQLLQLLQEDARHAATELAERVGVSDNTVHNRMERLEEAGVITGYTAILDHDRTGFSLYFRFACTARINRRSEVARELRDIPGIVEVTELMTGQRNLTVRAVGAEDDDISRIVRTIDELEVDINDGSLIRAEHTSSLDYDAIERANESQ